MSLAIPTTSFTCELADGLAHIVFNQPDRGNLLDGDFCREFSLAMAELSEREDVRAVLISARGKLFSVGGDIAALRDDNVKQVCWRPWMSTSCRCVETIRQRFCSVAMTKENGRLKCVDLMDDGSF